MAQSQPVPAVMSPDPSQEELKAHLSNKLSTYAYIFEGTILSMLPVKDENGEKWFAHLVQIHKDFRGNLQAGTVEVITKAVPFHTMFPLQKDTIGAMTIGTTKLFCYNTLCYIPCIREVPRLGSWCGHDPKDLEITYDNFCTELPHSNFSDTVNNKVKLGCVGGSIGYEFGYDKYTDPEFTGSFAIGHWQDFTAQRSHPIYFSKAEDLYAFLLTIPNTTFMDFTNQRFRKMKSGGMGAGGSETTGGI